MDESRIFQRVLECSFDPTSPNYLKSLHEELGADAQLLFSLADRVIESKLGQLHRSQALQTQFLNASYLRAEEWARKDKIPDDVKKDKMPELKGMLGRYDLVNLRRFFC